MYTRGLSQFESGFAWAFDAFLLGLPRPVIASAEWREGCEFAEWLIAEVGYIKACRHYGPMHREFRRVAEPCRGGVSGGVTGASRDGARVSP